MTEQFQVLRTARPGHGLSRRRSALVAGLVVVTSVVAGSGSASAAATKPTATEIGVTATEIRIAVIADVDNPIVPGLFQGSVDGVKGAAKYLNSKAGGGGVAGRKLVVDFVDSKLNANAARNATITACGQDLAMVGTSTTGLTTADDMVSCADQAGAATGLPDVPAITGAVEGCAPVAYPDQSERRDLFDHRPDAADLPDEPGCVHLPEEAAQEPARRLRVLQRHEGRRGDRAVADPRVDRRRHHRGFDDVAVGARSAERVHAGHPADEAGRLELPVHDRQRQRHDRGAQ